MSISSGADIFKTARLAVLIAIGSPLLLAACVNPQYQTISAETIPKLNADSFVYVAIPADGLAGKELALNSGRQTAMLLRDTFAKRAARVQLSRRNETFAEALQTARQFNCMYLVYPTVLLWEDRATELSGLRDRIEVKVEVTDVKSGDMLHATTFKGTGAWMPSDDDSPIDILKEPIARYVAALFRATGTSADEVKELKR